MSAERTKQASKFLVPKCIAQDKKDEANQIRSMKERIKFDAEGIAKERNNRIKVYSIVILGCEQYEEGTE